MWNWIYENINGIHKEKKLALKNDDEYFEFMIKDFNHRLKFSFLIGTLFGFVTGVTLLYMIFQDIN